MAITALGSELGVYLWRIITETLCVPVFPVASIEYCQSPICRHVISKIPAPAVIQHSRKMLQELIRNIRFVIQKRESNSESKHIAAC